MKLIERKKVWAAVLLGMMIAAPAVSLAQRIVHWQINPRGFPKDTSVFVDVNDGNVFRRDLPASAFMVSMDEFAGDQGGWIVNQQQAVAGWAGAQVLVMIDRSRTYTGEFKKAKRIMEAIVNRLDPKRDQVALATAPAQGSYSEAKLEQNFTNDKKSLLATIRRINPLPSDDKSGARICQALSESLRWFPEQTGDKYRVVVFLTGGADKGEGKGNCVQESYAQGKVPFFPIVFKLDRKYDDPRNAHKIENRTHELAQRTGGNSIFRRAENANLQFVTILWNRIRSQYHLKVNFPCYRPMPTTEHYSVLKVEGRDVEGIKFKATSQAAPIPQITALYPSAQPTRKNVDDGKVDLTIDGSGFCGPPGRVKAFVGGRPVSMKSQMPFRLVVSLDSAVETGTIKVINQYGQNGESPMKFTIAKAPKGAEASATLMFLIIAIVVLVVVAIVLVALRSRKAKIPADSAPSSPGLSRAPSAEDVRQSRGAKTMAMGTITNAKLIQADGPTYELRLGQNIIGREPSCQVTLELSGISREHARIIIEPDSGLVWLEDLGSTNGTYTGPKGSQESDMKKVEQKRPVSSGDLIWICGQKFTFTAVKQGAGPGEG